MLEFIKDSLPDNHLKIMKNEWLLEKFVEGKTDSKEINILIDASQTPQRAAQIILESAMKINEDSNGTYRFVRQDKNIDNLIDTGVYRSMETPMAGIDLWGYRINFIQNVDSNLSELGQTRKV